MGKTAHRRAAEEAFEERIRRDPEYVLALMDVLNKMRAGAFSHAGILGQLFRRSYNLVDAMIFADLHGWLCQGDILMAQVYVGHTPAGDDRCDLNNKYLAELPQPFSAFFEGGAGDSDGTLSWEQSINVGIVLPGTDEEKTETLSPWHAPLEVGYTEFSKTRHHLQSEWFLARWPYGDEWITLLYLANKKLSVQSILDQGIWVDWSEHVAGQA